MKILVTGSNGLVGSRLARVLVAQGHEVLGASRGTKTAAGAYAYVGLELSDAMAVDRAVDAFAPEVIINPASMTEVDACEKDPERAYRANVTAVANLAIAARRVGAHLLQVSTDYVFDGDHGPYGEDDVPNPRGVYAITKHMGEEAVRALAKPGAWTIARTAVVYGWPAAARPNFGAWLVNALCAKQTVKLFVDQIVTPSLADNVAEMLAELGTRRLAGIFHVCGATAVDRYTFGQKLCGVFGFDRSLLVPSKLADLKLASPRPLHSALRTEKIREALKVQPLSLDEQLRRFHSAWCEGRGSAAA
ncbi:MAG: SDR family oxidoreductase [Myxococcaceae bacterium]|nr:SDR family oxidoreductase [Myxococcaceae bacterium]